MPVADVIGGAHQHRVASRSSDGPSLYRMADSAGETCRCWLDERTPDSIRWTLNFAFIAAVLGGLSSIASLYERL